MEGKRRRRNGKMNGKIVKGERRKKWKKNRNRRAVRSRKVQRKGVVEENVIRKTKQRKE